MLCKFCQNFDYDALVSSPGGYKHHESWNHLQLSAKSGCELCQLVLKRVEETQKVDGWLLHHNQISCHFTWPTSINWKMGGEAIARLDVFTKASDPLCGLFPGRPVSPSVLDDECTGIMRNWLYSCKDQHSFCPSRSDNLLPTRVLDVGSEINEPHLVVSEGKSGQWASLSHCWGGAITLKTETRTIASRCQGIPMEDFPPTFQDAILITRNLGIRYLWIDALCILQDSQEDWITQAAKMDYVYEHATVTIAAEASPDCLTGIVKSTCDQRHNQLTLPKTWCFSKVKNVRGMIQFRVDIESRITRRSRGALSDRGWTLQEEILSPCILRFSAQQVMWRCPTFQFTEWQPQRVQKTRLTGKPDFARPLYDKLLMKSDSATAQAILDHNGRAISLSSFWYKEVANQYANRNLAFQSDKLVALSGIAKKVADISGWRYIAGLWLEDMHSGLAWLTPKANAIKHKTYIGPSWSWAQIDCAGTPDPRHEPLYTNDHVSSVTPLAEVINIRRQYVNEGSGAAEHWELDLRGQFSSVCSCMVPVPFLDIRPLTSLEYQYGLLTISYTGYELLPNIRSGEFRSVLCAAPRDEDHQTYVYLQLGIWEHSTANVPSKPVIMALILKRIGTNGQYERVGRAVVPMDPEQTREWPTGTFSIV